MLCVLVRIALSSRSIEYTQHTGINIKKIILNFIPNIIMSAAMECLPRDSRTSLKQRSKRATFFEPHKFYSTVCVFIQMFAKQRWPLKQG